MRILAIICFAILVWSCGSAPSPIDSPSSSPQQAATAVASEPDTVFGKSLLSKPINPDSVKNGIAYFPKTMSLDTFIANAIEVSNDYLILTPNVTYSLEDDTIRVYSTTIDTFSIAFKEADNENGAVVLVNGKPVHTTCLALEDDWKADISAMDYRGQEFYYYPAMGLVVLYSAPQFWTGKIMAFSVCHIIDLRELVSYASITFGSGPMITGKTDSLIWALHADAVSNFDDDWEVEISPVVFGTSKRYNQLVLKSNLANFRVEKVKVLRSHN